MRNRWWIIALVLTLALAIAWPAYAGILTSNNYVYLLRGQEIEVPVDILTQRGTPMVPPELLSRFGLTPVLEGERIVLERGPVRAELKLGEATALVDGRRLPLNTGPVLLSDRVLIPADLLPVLGVALEVEGKFIYLTDYGSGVPDLTTGPSFQPNLDAWTMTTLIRDGGQVGQLAVTMLSRELLLDSELPLPWGTRAQLLALIEDRTLLLVTLQGQGVRAMAFDPTKLTLIGKSGTQYEYLKQEIAVAGQVTLAVAPGASKTSVLVYPQVVESAVDFYYDPAASIIGRLPAK